MNSTMRKYRDDIIKVVGRGPMSSDEIQKIGVKVLGKKFAGVYPQDDVPKLKPGHYYIVNTGGRNGPGRHWTAIAVSKAGVPHVYDSFARNTRKLLWQEERKIIGSGAHPVESNKTADQRGSSMICGQLSLAWLFLCHTDGFRVADAA